MPTPMLTLKVLKYTILCFLVILFLPYRNLIECDLAQLDPFSSFVFFISLLLHLLLSEAQALAFGFFQHRTPQSHSLQDDYCESNI